MPKVSQNYPAQQLRTQCADWHAAFLTMLPSIQRHAQRAFRHLADHDREEAVQAVIANCALAFLRLVELGKPELGYATPLWLVRFRGRALVAAVRNAWASLAR